MDLLSGGNRSIPHTKNYQNDWAGVHAGKQVPEGSYYYLIDYDGDGTPDYKGWLYLTR